MSWFAISPVISQSWLAKLRPSSARRLISFFPTSSSRKSSTSLSRSTKQRRQKWRVQSGRYLPFERYALLTSHYCSTLSTVAPPESQTPKPSNAILDIDPQATVASDDNSDPNATTIPITRADSENSENIGSYDFSVTPLFVESFSADASMLLLTMGTGDGGAIAGLHIDGTEHVDDSQLLY